MSTRTSLRTRRRAPADVTAAQSAGQATPQQHALERIEERALVAELLEETGAVAREVLLVQVVVERGAEARERRALHPLDDGRGRLQVVRIHLETDVLTHVAEVVEQARVLVGRQHVPDRVRWHTSVRLERVRELR